MSDYADILREYVECPRSYGCGGDCCNRDRARAALDAFVAEDKRLREALEQNAAHAASEVARLNGVVRQIRAQVATSARRTYQ